MVLLLLPPSSFHVTISTHSTYNKDQMKARKDNSSEAFYWASYCNTRGQHRRGCPSAK
jgi:hypothetical protein